MAQAVDPKHIADTVTSYIVGAALAVIGYLLHKYTGFGDIDPATQAWVAGIVGPIVLTGVVWVIGYAKKADHWIREEAADLGIPGVSVDTAELALKSDLEAGLNELRSRFPVLEHAAPVAVEPDAPVAEPVTEAEPVAVAVPVDIPEPDDVPEVEDPLKGVDAS